MNVPKLMMRLVFALSVCLVSGAAMSDGEGKMTVEERAKVVKYLVDSQKETLDAVEKLSETQLKFKPAPEKWSVSEVAEHIALAEGLLFSQVEKAMADKPNPDWQEKTKGKTEFLEKVMINRQGKAQAPEAIVPTGRLSKAELIAKLKEGRAKTMRYAETTQEPLKSHTAEHPFPVFKTLNAYQWLIYIPLHNIRHNQQIAEVMASPNFPKN